MAPGRQVEDRRVRRTRQMLQQAFRDVVREKGFAATTIQDITERANVNRGTFYLHFADKYMLVDAFVREDFQKLMTKTLPADAGWNKETVRLLIHALLGHFEHKYRHQPHIPQAVAPLVERAIHEELVEILLTWLRQRDEREVRNCVPSAAQPGKKSDAGVCWSASQARSLTQLSGIPDETIARVTSWAIFGTILQWSQEESPLSLEQMTNDILHVVMEGGAHLL